MKFPVVVPTLVSHDWFERTMKALMAQRPIEADVFLIQQSATVEEQCRRWTGRANVFAFGRNVGLAGAWNRSLPLIWDRGYSAALLLNDDLVLTDTRTLTTLRDILLLQLRQLRYLHDRGYSAICMTKAIWDEVGPFDEGYWPCLVPETPVLTDDLRWVPIGGLQIGDSLIGIDEFPEQKGASRSYRRAIVQGLKRHRADCMRLTLRDGRQVTCSLNHRWLTKLRTSGKRWFWREASRLRPGDHICAPLRVWDEDRTYEAGWLAGIFDGEGSLHMSPRKRGMSMSQVTGAVLERTKALLEAAHVPFSLYSRNGNEVKVIEINRRQHVLELLGRIRPLRLLRNEVWDGLRIRTKYDAGGLPIESIEPIGRATVVDLQTSSRTFLANGLVSHNSYFEDNDHHWRCKLAHIPWDEILIDTEHWGSGTLKADSRFSSLNATAFSVNAQRYQAKWGGGPHQEAWAIPWNGGPPRPSTRDLIPPDVVEAIERPYAFQPV